MVIQSGVGRAVQGEIYARGAYGHRPKVPVDPEGLALAASEVMSPEAWGYVAGSAGSQRTAIANVEAFERYPIVPRMLRDVSTRSLSVNLFGDTLSAPILFAPIGVLDMVHPEAERAVATAARELEIPMVLSTQGSVPMEETAKVLHGGGSEPSNLMWYQLYWSNNHDLARSLVGRAERAGARAIVVTLDTHLLGWRTRDLDLGFLPFIRGQGLAQYMTDPVFLELVKAQVEQQEKDKKAGVAPTATGPVAIKQRPTLAAIKTMLSMARYYPGNTLANIASAYPRAAVETFLDVFPCSGITWSDLAVLRKATRLPIVLKGIQSPADAELAVRYGVDGIVVSNHGGRQVDGAIASLDALEAIAPVVDGRIPILFDSGVRNGADVFKALALGADAVLVGRPWLFGLAIDGAQGAKAVMERIVAELDLTMALSGVRNVQDIGRDCVAVEAKGVAKL